MMIRILRSIVGLAFVFLLALFTVALVQAEPPAQDQQPQPQEQQDPETVLDCRECHWDVYLNWEQSAHGRGLSCGQCHLSDQGSHAREGHGAQGGAQACMGCHTTGYDPDADTWEEDNVHCTACHTPIEPNHPDVPMPTDRSEELCGQCHIQARFEWEVSAHGAAGVACVSCHNQHTTSLKDNSVSEECANCHETYAEGFSHSIHYGEGLSCANCHLAPLDGPVGEGSAKRDHTFTVNVKTCVACHAEGLHNATKTAGSDTLITFHPEASDPTDAMASSITVEVSDEPAPVSPFGFVALGGIVLGLAIGGVIVGMAIVIIPWIGHQYRQVRRQET